MRRDMVFKYGPLEPESGPGIIHPFHPGSRSMLIKYGPPSPRRIIKARTEEQVTKQTKAISKQIARCLKKIKELLEKPEITTDDLGLCMTELSLLYLKLNDLKNSGKQEDTTTEIPRHHANRRDSKQTN